MATRLITKQIKQKISVDGNVFSNAIDIGALSDNVFVQVTGQPDITTLSDYITYMETQIGVNWEEI